MNKVNASRPVKKTADELTTLLRNIPGGIASFSVEGGRFLRTFLSEGAREILGYAVDETPGVDISATAYRIHLDDRGRLQRAIDDAIAARGPFSVDMRVLPQAGEVRWVNLSARPADDGLTYYGIYSNVTQRKTAEEALRVSEEQCRIVLAQSGRGLFRYSIKDRVADNSGEVARQFGIPTRIENAPKTLVDMGLVGAQSVQTWYDFFDSIDAGNPSGSAAVSARLADGRFRWFNMHFAGIKSAAGLPVTAIVSYHDVTAKREADKSQEMERSGLYQALRIIYPLIILCNLTKNSYRILEYEHFATKAAAQSGRFDDLIDVGASTIPDADRARFRATFSRKNLLDSFSRGVESVRLEHRQRGDDGVLHWNETSVLHIENLFDDDVLEITTSRCIDEQKATENRLRETLSATSGELSERLHFGDLVNAVAPGLILLYYPATDDLAFMTGSFGGRIGYSQAEILRLFKADLKKLVHPDDAEALLRDKRRLAEQLPTESSMDYRVVGARGEIFWVAQTGKRFTEKDGRIGYVFTINDVTEKRALIERLNANMCILRAVAEHSERVVYYYDHAQRKVEAVDTGLCAASGLAAEFCDIPASLLRSDWIFSDSLEALKNLFSEIGSGVRSGEIRLHMRCLDKVPRWFDLRFTTILSQTREVQGAVLSMLDITSQHEQELSYARYLESISLHKIGNALYVEADLTADSIEKYGGRPLSLERAPEEMGYDEVVRGLVDTYFSADIRPHALKYFSRENLLSLFNDGQRNTAGDWQIRLPRGGSRWLHITNQFVNDPYSGHVRVFILVNDVTHEKESLLSIQRRAERDGLTGVYNRETAERLINGQLADGKSSSLLILIDLDDLKGINDTLGHQQGDRALCSLADALRSHFRSSDIISRVGGDEFVVFLHGVESEAAIRASVSKLIRRVSQLRVGENDTDAIHCSAGCVMTSPQTPESFSALFKKADTALYHVKRNGKNDYAFYLPDMQLADYKFIGNPHATLRYNDVFDPRELQRLLAMFSRFYPLVVSADLTKDSYYLMESKDFDADIPGEGTLDELLCAMQKILHPEDCESYSMVAGREALLADWEKGVQSRHFFSRQRGRQGGYRWIETILLLYKNEGGDICSFSFARESSERQKDGELQRLQEILRRAVAMDFECLCLVDPAQGSYALYGGDCRTMKLPATGQYGDIERCLRAMAPAEVLGENADLACVLRQMEKSDRFEYAFCAGAQRFTVDFCWYEASHRELIMTVRSDET
ncbi:MAG: diguanylate cyclase [Oscillospiraceae bacterium]|nr:diguanylate cyclase [Oscillospiraceae bacterium]